MKYELTTEKKTVDGVKLRRIRALKGFGCVKAGDLGGWLESEKNLSQDGLCWVSGNAGVYGDARVSGNAMVSGNALINSQSDLCHFSNVGTENGTLTVFRGKDSSLVTRGCFLGTVDEFLTKSKAVHDKKTRKEYKLLIKVALSRLNVAPLDI